MLYLTELGQPVARPLGAYSRRRRPDPRGRGHGAGPGRGPDAPNALERRESRIPNTEVARAVERAIAGADGESRARHASPEAAIGSACRLSPCRLSVLPRTFSHAAFPVTVRPCAIRGVVGRKHACRPWVRCPPCRRRRQTVRGRRQATPFTVAGTRTGGPGRSTRQCRSSQRECPPAAPSQRARVTLPDPRPTRVAG